MKVLSFILQITIYLVCCTFFSNCENSDDIEEIFIGKNWKIHGATFNGVAINGKVVNELYSSTDSYWINFSVTTFEGKLQLGNYIRGIWSADGKSKAIQIKIKTNLDINSSTLGQQIYQVLDKATSYSGDSNVLTIYQDRNNFVRLSKHDVLN